MKLARVQLNRDKSKKLNRLCNLRTILWEVNALNDTVKEHRYQAPRVIRCAVITVSDTRNLENDKSGQAVMERLGSAGHEVVFREIVPDESTRIRELLVSLWEQTEVIDAILITGGTGVAERDKTYETVEALLTKSLPGYGELFRMISYQEIGAAAMLSRASGGLLGRIVLLTMPGSLAAVSLAMNKLILPELGHLVNEARK